MYPISQFESRTVLNLNLHTFYQTYRVIIVINQIINQINQTRGGAVVCCGSLVSPNKNQVRQLLKKMRNSQIFQQSYHVYGVAFVHLIYCHQGPKTSCGVCEVAYICANYSTDCQTLAQTQQHLIICVCVCVTVWEMQFVNLKWTIA